MKIMRHFMVVNMMLVAFLLGLSKVEAKTYTTYKKGDLITVNVNAEEKEEFYVIQDSSSEEQNVLALLKGESYPNKYTYEEATRKVEEYRTIWKNVSEVSLPKMIDILGMDASTLEKEGTFTEPIYAIPTTSYWLQDLKLFDEKEGHWKISIHGLDKGIGAYSVSANEVSHGIRPVIHAIKENVVGGVIEEKEEDTNTNVGTEVPNPNPSTNTDDQNTNVNPSYKVYGNGTAIYYNPETNQICNSKDAVSTTGTKVGCMKWYIFNDDASKAEVNMILDHNTTVGVGWNSTGGVEMKEAKVALENDTKTWKKQARLITADEIAHIVGADREDTLKWKANKKYVSFKNFYQSNWSIEENIAEFYLDGLVNANKTSYRDTDGWNKQVASSSRKSSYAWLYDHLLSCTDYGCNVAQYVLNVGLPGEYYTSTVVIANDSDNPVNSVFVVSREGKLDTAQIGKQIYTGIRPVIAVEKSVLQGNENNSSSTTISKTCPNDSRISLDSCLKQGNSMEDCIKKNCPGTEKIENPKTGIRLSFVVLGSILTAIFIYISKGKKTYFKKIR